MSAKPRSIKSDLSKVDAHIITPEEYEELPELSDAEFAAGVVSTGMTPKEIIAAIEVKKRGRPKGSGQKVSTTVRFDADILEAFRAGGEGWQTRMNDALRDWLKRRKTRVQG
jgi:uncharacterized protein (DUF4415 family)